MVEKKLEKYLAKSVQETHTELVFHARSQVARKRIGYDPEGGKSCDNCRYSSGIVITIGECTNKENIQIAKDAGVDRFAVERRGLCKRWKREA